MVITYVNSDKDLSAIVHVLNVSHDTVAKEFGFTKENNPTNNAFIDELTLREQLNKGIDLYAMSMNGKRIGCIAIEKSTKEIETFYIEKVSVLPDYRNRGYGVELMNFATSKIREHEGKVISIALIDSNTRLKSWYSAQGFIETGTKDFEHLPFRVCFMNKQI
jgi:ribosomal protein S18 acetylase RimI-like enzyme